MPLKAKCRCGRVLKVRDSMAGKRVRCPECESPVRIPAPKPKPKPEPVYEEFDDYGDDYGEEEDPYSAPPPRPRKKKSSGKKKKSSGGGVPMPLIIVGCVVAGLIGLGATAYMFLSGGDSPAVADSTDASSANDGTASASAPSANGSSNAAGSSAEHGADAEHAAASEHGGGATASTDSDAEHGMDGSTDSDTAAVSNTAAATPVSTGSQVPKVWVVLSNFRETTPAGSIGKVFQVDYRIASGSPDPSRNYVLYLGSRMGIMERYNEVEINLTTNGTVQIPGGLGMSGETRAYVAWKQGRQKWKPVSGEITVGGGPTAAKRPPTVAESAGAAAQGKMLAVAKPRFEQSLGRKALVVDYVLQKPFEPGKRYFLAIRGNGEPVMTDVTTNLMRAKQGETNQFGVRVMGPGGFPKGNLSIRVERRIGLFTRNSEQPDIVSNSATLRQ